jgi:hypothetical protein
VGPCGGARIGYGDSVLNDPDSRRLSVMVACEWSHARCEWSLTQRPRVGRSLGPGAGGGGIPSPQAERRNPRTGDRGDFQFAAPGHDGSRTDEDPARRMYACTHNSKFAQLRYVRTPFTYACVAASVLCIAVHRAPGPFLCFSENIVKIESTSKLD